MAPFLGDPVRVKVRTTSASKHCQNKNLLPLTYTKPVSKLRVGILTIKEKWEHFIENPIQIKTQDYLSKKFGDEIIENSMGINGSVLPNDDLMSSLLELKNNQILTKKGNVIAINPLPTSTENLSEILSTYKKVDNTMEFLLKNLIKT